MATQVMARVMQSDVAVAGPAFPRARLVFRRRRVDWARATDDELVIACAKRDDDAFAEVVRRYERPLFNVAYRLLAGHHEDATDATQQALIHAYRALPSSRLGLPIRPWLFRILRNQCIDRLRRKEAIPFSRLRASEDEDDEFGIDAPDSSPLPEELAERSDLEQIIHSAIGTLSPRYRAVVTLRYQGDLSFAEIGACLGVPEPTARTLFQRAKATLRKVLVGQI
jgi:RNA polymerase sigma-70 factor (ECF subfamily)